MQEETFDEVTVVCVTYQSQMLAESLAEHLQPFSRIIVVDNGSTDGTVATLKRLIPRAYILQRHRNGGFGTANNEAMARVRTPLALLLNPDCTISPESLHVLMKCMEQYPSAGLVAPQGWRDDRRPQKSFRTAFYERQVRQPYHPPDATCSAQWLNGCCLLVRTSAFEDVGGFDERFFLYYEDDDLCLRMQRAGYECLIEPAASALHGGGASSTPSIAISLLKAFHYARSRHLAICRYQGRGAGYWYLARTLLAAVPLSLIFGLTLQRRRLMRWLAWGLAAACGLLAQPPKKINGKDNLRFSHHVAKQSDKPIKHRVVTQSTERPLREDQPAEQ
jgi:GT2 family glycosyltransferase